MVYVRLFYLMRTKQTKPPSVGVAANGREGRGWSGRGEHISEAASKERGFLQRGGERATQQ